MQGAAVEGMEGHMTRVRGAMDNASDYGSEDSRFESWRARLAFQSTC